MTGFSSGIEPLGAADLLDVRLIAIRYAARDTHLYEFARIDGGVLPEADAGSHVDIHLPNGLVRQYSLTEAGPDWSRYVVGIKRDAAGKGGSRYIHDSLRVGTVLKIGAPRNNFPLEETASHSVLIAGGIGITPIRCMARRLITTGRSWEMHYSARSRADAAFLDELAALPQVHFHFDDEQDGRFLDIAGIAARAAHDAHLYCCGPTQMLQAFEAAAAGRPGAQVHVEYFTARQEAATEGGFSVQLAKSGGTYLVPPGKTILEVVRMAGIDAPSSCEQGVCGACETRVITGIADHRDAILSDAERQENKTMMICCSGAKSDLLVLDL